MKANIRNTEIYFDIAGMQLTFADDGSLIERPVIFLLHGGPGSDHVRFKRHTLALQEIGQLVFIDHRGCGRSKKTQASEYTLENNIEDIEALRQHLGLNRISLLGISYGGIVAQGYAIRYGNHLNNLALVATAPSYRAEEQARLNLKKHGSPEQIKMCEHLWAGSFKDPDHVAHFFKVMAPLYSVAAREGRKSPLPESSSTWSHEALNQGFGDFLRHFDFVPNLPKITCPTLILAGDSDWICPAEQSQIMAEHIPNAQLKIFKNCSHAITTDAHEQYIEAIKQFFKSA